MKSLITTRKLFLDKHTYTTTRDPKTQKMLKTSCLFYSFLKKRKEN